VPRISGDSIAEHVARQEEAVVQAAIRLFTERGAAQVTMADIATEVGLARNSLYRYFPDKSHIVATWFRREMGPLKEAGETVAAGEGRAVDRLADWVVLHLGYLSTPEHRRMLQAVTATDVMPAPLRREIADGHEQLYQSLVQILADLGTTSELVTRLIVSMVRTGADMVGDTHPLDSVAGDVVRAVLAVARS